MQPPHVPVRQDPELLLDVLFALKRGRGEQLLDRVKLFPLQPWEGGELADLGYAPFLEVAMCNLRGSPRVLLL